MKKKTLNVILFSMCIVLQGGVLMAMNNAEEVKETAGEGGEEVSDRVKQAVADLGWMSLSTGTEYCPYTYSAQKMSAQEDNQWMARVFNEKYSSAEKAQARAIRAKLVAERRARNR